MKKRLWYDLSNDEMEDLEDKWLSSSWYRKASKDSWLSVFTNIYIIFFSVITFGVSIYAISLIREWEGENWSNIELSYVQLVGAIAGALVFILVISIAVLRRKFIERNKSKFLLDKFNVEK